MSKNDNEHASEMASGDPADRQALLTAIVLGADLETAAKEIGIPISLAKRWIDNPSALLEMSGIRDQLMESLCAHGSSVVSSALQVLDDALSRGEATEASDIALKLAVASGVLTAGQTAGVLDRRLNSLEVSNRIRFLTKLDGMGVSEEEWNVVMRPASAGAPKVGRPKKRR